MLETFQGADNTKREYIKPLVQYIGERKQYRGIGYAKEL